MLSSNQRSLRENVVVQNDERTKKNGTRQAFGKKSRKGKKLNWK